MNESCYVKDKGCSGEFEEGERSDEFAVSCRSPTIHHLDRVGHRPGGKHAGSAGEIVQRGWKFQHRALRKNLRGRILEKSEIGVIKTWLSTYFVIGAWEIVFCNAPPEKTPGGTSRVFNFRSCISEGWVRTEQVCSAPFRSTDERSHY